MSLKTFIFGLSASFGVAWLAVVVVPYFKMRDLQPIPMSAEPDSGIFFPKRTGRIADGALVYSENGCYLCHTQVIRPTYAGNDLYRPDWGGLAADPDRGDTRRETNAFDFFGESYAHIGLNRLGPDLSNVGRRVEEIYAKDGDPKAWLYNHLYNPRMLPERRESGCPSFRFLFDKQKINGNRNAEALPIAGDDSTELVPSSDAKALVSYLLSMKKDQPVATSLNFAPAKKDSDS
ncbi:cbb3-type cytochrome c oxidase subunit II [Luteolibacter pohnpeiensis]|uniref:Cbb3-type cytochrome c oxidase subunit II n=1 Tax=Luteolibacter pohnpeiensis TaxID=454153 RepID=A0A934S9L3_9BACT|nr:cbb3-type cytochrome c oxidase subunit II [Luteolibacter pohnpeiensis]MBK1884353.1 cbb3-type cytochrome c oxidase subunit II [Luteolibacter pohnpeiensis]